MNQTRRGLLLTTSSLLSLLLFMLHVTDDIVRGFEDGDLSNLGAFPIFVVWLYGTLMLAERRSGHMIILLASILSAGVPVLHMTGSGFGVRSSIGGTEGAFFFVWALLALGTSALFSIILSLQGLWSLRRRAGDHASDSHAGTSALNQSAIDGLA